MKRVLERIRAGWPAAAILPVVAVLGACSDDATVEGERFPVRSVEETDVAGTSTGPSLPPPEANADWPQKGGNAGRSGFHPSFGGERLVLWRYSAAAGVNDDWPNSVEPVVSGGTVYVLDGRTELHAVNAAQGRASWRVSLQPDDESGLDGVGGGVALDAGRLFVSTSYAQVIALDAADGAILWRRNLSAPSHSAPAATDGMVAVLTGDDRLTVFDAASGEPRWEALGPGAQTVYLDAPAPAVRDGILVVPFSSGELGAYALEGGESEWRRILASGEENSPLALFRDLTSDPVMDRELVYAGTRRGEFSAFSWETGEIAWQLPVGSPSPGWAAGGSVFLVDSNTRIARVNSLDGLILWRRQLEAYEDPDDLDDPIHYTAPVLAGGVVLLGSTDGRLLAFDAASGEQAWELSLGAGMRASPVVAGGVAYLFLDDGTLIAMR